MGIQSGDTHSLQMALNSNAMMLQIGPVEQGEEEADQETSIDGSELPPEAAVSRPLLPLPPEQQEIASASKHRLQSTITDYDYTCWGSR